MGHSWIWPLIILLVAAAASSCDNGKGHPCTRVCAYAEECWGEDGLNECMEDCPTFVQEVEEAGYDAQVVADCFLEEATCMDMISYASIYALIWECAERQDTRDAGTDPEHDPAADPGVDHVYDPPVDTEPDPGEDPAADTASDPNDDLDEDGPTETITAQAACEQIGQAFCNRRDDCLGEGSSDLAHCRNDVRQDCETVTGMVPENDVQTCVALIDDGNCDTIFDESGNPIQQPDCPEL